MAAQPPPRLLLTRPLRDSRGFAERVEVAMPGRWRFLIAPLMKIERTSHWPDLRHAEYTLLTSTNAVPPRDMVPTGHPAWCVGPATKAAATAAGFAARRGGATSRELVQTLAAAPPAGRGIWLRGHHVITDIARELRAAGLDVCDAEVYATRPCAWPAHVSRDLAAGHVAAVALFSPRSAELFSEAAAGLIRSDFRAFCLSPQVAGAVAGVAPDRVLVSRSPDAQGMIDLLKTYSERIAQESGRTSGL